MSLRKLIEAVEAGALTDEVMALPDQRTTDLCYAAYRGSLDAAKAVHIALLRGWVWGRTEGNVWVKNPAKNRLNVFWGGPNENAARSWLLAILRALAEGR